MSPPVSPASILRLAPGAGPVAIERMISTGENATRLALSRFTAQAA